MSYVEKNLVPGETLLYQTRHHWIVLIGPLLIALLVGLPGLFLIFEVAAKRPEIYDYVTRMPGGAETLIAAVVPVIAALTAITSRLTVRRFLSQTSGI